MEPSAVPWAQLGAPALGTGVVAVTPRPGTPVQTPPEMYPKGCYTGCVKMQGRVWSAMKTGDFLSFHVNHLNFRAFCPSMIWSFEDRRRKSDGWMWLQRANVRLGSFDRYWKPI